MTVHGARRRVRHPEGGGGPRTLWWECGENRERKAGGAKGVSEYSEYSERIEYRIERKAGRCKRGERAEKV